MGALLFGAGLAEKAGLQEKLVTNQERFDEMCRDLSDKAVAPDDSLRRIASKLHAAERYRFVPESDFDIERILNCVRLAAKALVASDPGLEASVKVHFERIASVDRSDQYAVLDALRELDTTIGRGLSITELDQPRAIAFRLVRLAWGCTFINHFWLKKQREMQGTEPTGS